MTTSTWTATDCPKCRATSTVELDTDQRLCLECRHEWAPSTTDGPLEVERPPVELYVAEVAHYRPDVADLPEAPAHIAAARSRYLGAGVLLPELGVSGVVVEITGDGWAVVELTADHDVMALPSEFTVTDADVISDETVRALATTDMAIAAQVLRAGAATVITRGDTRTLGMPPDGWLPPDPDVMPVIEHGAAYAIAILATTAGISTDDLAALAARLDEAATAAEGTDNDGQ